MIICQFCKSDLIVSKVDDSFCPNCYPEIHYMQISNNEIIGYIIKSNKEYKIYYDYCFDDLTFEIDIYSTKLFTNRHILNKSFENIKISSSKELEDFGDRIYNLLAFI